MDMEKFLTSKTSFVFLMVSNPKPCNSVTVENAKYSVSKSDACRPNAFFTVDAFKME